ncbi:MAG: TIGR00296 family protein, partial [Methanoregulaceae archaeon]|nr:TIGR00296 family protein [Methanoregulaceae archaeon]
MHALTDEEGALAVRVARRVLENSIGSLCGDLPALPPVFQKKRGVFVTLTRDGELRGCIGFPYPILPLTEALSDAAISAATRDPRFPPVRAPELPLLRIEVTILTVPEPLTAAPEARPAAVEVGKHGLIVQGYGRSGLLLPQVPVEWGWDSTEFLDHTCMKAGL